MARARAGSDPGPIEDLLSQQIDPDDYVQVRRLQRLRGDFNYRFCGLRLSSEAVSSALAREEDEDGIQENIELYFNEDGNFVESQPVRNPVARSVVPPPRYRDPRFAYQSVAVIHSVPVFRNNSADYLGFDYTVLFPDKWAMYQLYPESLSDVASDVDTRPPPSTDFVGFGSQQGLYVVCKGDKWSKMNKSIWAMLMVLCNLCNIAISFDLIGAQRAIAILEKACYRDVEVIIEEFEEAVRMGRMADRFADNMLPSLLNLLQKAYVQANLQPPALTRRAGMAELVRSLQIREAVKNLVTSVVDINDQCAQPGKFLTLQYYQARDTFAIYAPQPLGNPNPAPGTDPSAVVAARVRANPALGDEEAQLAAVLEASQRDAYTHSEADQPQPAAAAEEADQPQPAAAAEDDDISPDLLPPGVQFFRSRANVDADADPFASAVRALQF